MLNSAFDGVGAKPGDYYPEDLRDEIGRLNGQIYGRVNNGVYKAGFATTQAAYEEAVLPLFATLDELEERLGRQRYLCGGRITEADWRLFTTLVRFDAVYHGHFKCNIRRIADYPSLWGYTRELYQWPGVRQTVDFQHIKHHYYESHKTINPSGIVPLGPALDFEAPHGREQLPAGLAVSGHSETRAKSPSPQPSPASSPRRACSSRPHPQRMRWRGSPLRIMASLAPTGRGGQAAAVRSSVPSPLGEKDRMRGLIPAAIIPDRFPSLRAMQQETQARCKLPLDRHGGFAASR